MFLRDVMDWRTASTIATAASAAFLAASIVYFVRSRRAEPKREPIERRVKPYEELIVEAVEEPEVARTAKLKNLEDLVRVSELTGKAILHVRKRVEGGEVHRFCVVDGNVKYVYEVPPEQVE